MRTEALAGSLLNVSRRGASHKVRTVNNLLSMGSGVEFGVHNADIDTAVRGLLERVFFVQLNGRYQHPIQPSSGSIDNKLSTFKRKLTNGWPSTTPISKEKFLGYYRGRKLAVYKSAVESLTIRPVERKDAYLDTFVKAEKINFSAKPDPAPRVIQPRSPRFNVEVGCYLKPIEHEIYHKIGGIFGSPVVVKGMNASERGKLLADKWSKFAHPVAIGYDAKRFDQHCSREILQWEHSIYLSIYGGDEKLKQLLSWQLDNKGFVNCQNGRAKYKTRGCRTSGDMNTALGNVTIMCAMMWSYLESLGIKYEFLNDGDDCVIIVERSDEWLLDTLPSWFQTLGFVMEREKTVNILERVQFCQAQPVYNGESYCMVRNPRSCLSKDLISTKSCIRRGEWNSARAAIADCGLALAGNMPVMNEFYNTLQRDVGNVKHNWGNDLPGMYFLRQGMHARYERPTEEARYSFYLAFDITPDEQTALEEYYRNLKPTWKPLGVEPHVTSFPSDPCISYLLRAR